MSVLGALIAGGASTRYGAPKALATVGGRRIFDRARAALLVATEECVAIINDPLIAEQVEVPVRPDIVTGAGALGGLHAALSWAQERDDAAILALGCDMPFVPASLLQALVARWQRGGADAVLPESGGPRGCEPLCAIYGVACRSAIERALQRGDRRMISFHDEIRLARLPLAEVKRYGDVDLLFFNVNTPASREHAERIASRLP